MRVVGSKPAVYLAWVFELLQARTGDSLDALYPGSGRVPEAWEAWRLAHDGYAPAPRDASSGSSP
jgi:hypothetical protein